MAKNNDTRIDEFTLYDLRVECIAVRNNNIASYKVGDYFELRGEELFLPKGQGFSIYALASLLPLLPVKQRNTHPNDWITTDTDVSCPDPNVGGLFRITRIGKRVFKHNQVSRASLKNENKKK